MDDVDELLAAHGRELQILWDFMQIRHQLGAFDAAEQVDRAAPVEFIAVLGSHDDRNAVRAADVFFDVQRQPWQRGVVPWVVTTGWESGSAHALWGKSEAAHLADLLKANDVPAGAILQDHWARNLGENARHVAVLLTAAAGLSPRHGVIACKDYIGLRALATFEKQFPGQAPVFTVQSPGLSLETWLANLGTVPARHDMSTFVGDVGRVIFDPDGYLSDRVAVVPDQVRAAHDTLVAAGFVRGRTLGPDRRTVSPLPHWATRAAVTTSGSQTAASVSPDSAQQAPRVAGGPPIVARTPPSGKGTVR